MAASGSSSEKVYQLKVVLRGSTPPIWRRLQVPGTTTLAQLHSVLQIAMGWMDCHLHRFEIAGVAYGTDDGGGWGPAPKDEGRTRLDRVAQKGTRLLYEYDFGDGWEHDIKVEAVLAAEEGKTYPRCTAGQRAGPPEDCGGIWGYEELLMALADPGHDEHDELLEWVGGEFDSEWFEVGEINRALAPARRTGRPARRGTSSRA